MAKTFSTKKKTNSSKKQIKPWEWSAVDPRKVLTVNKEGILLLGKDKITETELKNLQAEAKSLKQMAIWSLMQETLKQKAIEMGFVNAETWERTMSGKMMLHNLGILDSIVDVLSKTPTTPAPLTSPRPLQRPILPRMDLPKL